MDNHELRQQIADFLKFSVPADAVSFLVQDSVQEEGFRRMRISYPSAEGDEIPAFLLIPSGAGPFGAVLVQHQHHNQFHLGKSEVCGLVGDPFQAFGPALARQGILVLAPDSIGFEDRRKYPGGAEEDAAQYYNEMCNRLLRGDTLMNKVLGDSALGISLLCAHPLVDPQRVGILGHSMGGNTALFHGALDERVRFACVSGAVCSYRYRLEKGIGIEAAEVIPGFAKGFDLPDLLACFGARRLLVVSAAQDKYSQDAEEVVAAARELAAENRIDHQRYYGGHGLTRARFDEIIRWTAGCAKLEE